MNNSFKDHFSHDSAAYSKNRPGYPDALFEYLASLSPNRDLAWDCATGSGQSAFKLAQHFARVIATDASASQIENAMRLPNISYRVASAEMSGISSGSVDLVTVAQALHWFDLPAFTTEVERLLKPGGILAAWTYKLLHINTEIDTLAERLYSEILNGCWPPERQLVEEGYRNIRFPLDVLESPRFKMSTAMNADQLLAYLSTWSAVKIYREQHGTDPLDQIRDDIYAAWGEDKTAQLRVEWPLAIRLWQKT